MKLFSKSNILYIGTNEVCLLNGSFSKVIYFSEKRTIDYKKVVDLVTKTPTIIFINSFFAFAEHRSISAGLGKKEIKKSIDERLAKPDVVCATYNHLFKKGKGGTHTNDVVMTIIKADDSERHIKKILSLLANTNADLTHIYSFDQAINSLSMSYSILNHSINVNVALLDNSAMIMASNTTHFMFGRLIKKRDGEELITTMSSMLAMTLKYISTTYSFLTNEPKITIMSSGAVDVNTIRGADPIFGDTKITTKKLSLPKITQSPDVKNITTELQLLKLAVPSLKYVNKLDNNRISIQKSAFVAIKILQRIAFASVILTILYCCYRIMDKSKLSAYEKQIETKFDNMNAEMLTQQKKIKTLTGKSYYFVARELKNSIYDNSHVDTMKKIADIFKKHRDLTYVEGYKLSCENCTQKDRKNTLTIDFAFYNVNSSARYAVDKLSVLEKEILTLLEKDYKNVNISYSQITKNKRALATRDVRDTMVITFSR